MRAYIEDIRRLRRDMDFIHIVFDIGFYTY